MSDYAEYVCFPNHVCAGRYHCDCCNRYGRVIEIQFPATTFEEVIRRGYFKQHLSTKYCSLFFCRACADKLLAALAPACAEIREAEKEDE